jgi:MOSC domain-containing protein YiiM
MRVLSVNVGLPREVTWRGGPITTGTYKQPVSGPVRIRTLNLDGDRQADLRVHGGPDKAVYAYPFEFYELWSRERPDLDLDPGTFGENLTTEGLRDGDVAVGDRFRVGTAELVVTQPRLPCFKLGITMGRDGFVTEFLERGLYGFYLAVLREGEVEAGDPIFALRREPAPIPSDEGRPSPRQRRRRRPAFVPRTTGRCQETTGAAGASNPQVRPWIRPSSQVAKSAPRTLSRWRHGFERRWDYAAKHAGHGSDSGPRPP